jgi:thiamine-monophosphate kinase
MSLSEFQIIKTYFDKHYQDSSVIKGIGDDCAIVQIPQDKQLAISMDTLVKGVHFPNETSAYDIGYKTLAVNLSDLAAMGAMPKWMTLSLSLPEYNEQWLKDFSQGLFDCASPYGVKLIGGDTIRSALSITIQIHGFVDKETILYRSGAQVDDLICVSDFIGEAAAGLHSLQAGQVNKSLLQKLNRPTAQVALGQALAGKATACIDISDGLSSDLLHILKASSVGAELDLNELQRNSKLTASFNHSQIEHFILNGGDDYQLCFTINKKYIESIAKQFPKIKTIGIIVKEKQCTLKTPSGHRPLTIKGYNHFD